MHKLTEADYQNWAGDAPKTLALNLRLGQKGASEAEAKRAFHDLAEELERELALEHRRAEIFKEAMHSYEQAARVERDSAAPSSIDTRCPREVVESVLTKLWPLWRDPKNIGGTHYQSLVRAIEAGWEARPSAIAPKLPNHLEICQAVARGWCSPANANKEMDAELAFAIAVQVEALFSRPDGSRHG